MNVYGNKVIGFGNNSLIESFNFERITSFVLDEYYNYSNLLNECVDSEQRSLIEAKVEVLEEIALKDVIYKIK